jgi:hypothetical protein
MFRIVAIALIAAGVTSAAVINFDSIAAGTTVTNQFAAQGVIFQSSPGSFSAQNNTFGGAVIVPSAPNYLAIGGNGVFDIVSGGNPGTTNSIVFDLLGLNSGGGFYNGSTVTLLDINGATITSLVIQPVGPNQSVSVGTVSVTLPGIHEVQFSPITNNAGGGLFGIDNLNIGAVTAATPEPGSVLLVCSGIAAALMARRKAHIR